MRILPLTSITKATSQPVVLDGDWSSSHPSSSLAEMWSKCQDAEADLSVGVDSIIFSKQQREKNSTSAGEGRPIASFSFGL